jgi:hypothetical protein
MRRTTGFLTGVLLIACSGRPVSTPARQASDAAAAHHERGVEFHLRRSLDDASRKYAAALKLDPPRGLKPEEWRLVLRFAPRVFTTPTEFFPLKDFAAVLHPTERLIAYHFFWADDIDFPEDNDPCDHEVVWVKFAPDRRSVEQVWTYFHGHILAGGAAALADARRHAMRPRVNVQWGKHGSLLVGWEEMKVAGERADRQPLTLRQYNEATFRQLSQARRLADHPLGVRLGWPRRFAGTWRDFTDFSRPVDARGMLVRNRMALVSRWNSATINQHFLAYNFRPKTEWPVEKE